ncbi:hypothetical protein RF11_06165 [Thelohanellus kitauei]|uniref:Uncharacterized protein n=1 Tax=Thelohanellus kitauei TaxID=669202 RepID=A0A0C2M107_THEKT|nr:hypothetical protein RF11_06165 [Thelohanellus kitauei]
MGDCSRELVHLHGSMPIYYSEYAKVQKQLAYYRNTEEQIKDNIQNVENINPVIVTEPAIKSLKAASSIATISNFDNLNRSTMSSILHKFRKGASVEIKKSGGN